MAIPNPNSRHISDNKMRCLTKCISMFGLGHYIYAGEDLPSEEKASKPKPKKKQPSKAVIKGDKKKSLRDESLDIIKRLITHDAFNEDAKATINSFVSSINDSTDDSEIIKWAGRMQDVTYKFDNNKESK